MNSGTMKAYLKGRYETILSFYDSKASWNKCLYNLSSALVITGSILIVPLLRAGALGLTIASFISPVVAILVGLVSHFHFHENWLRYRRTWDLLKRELEFMKGRVPPYDKAGHERLFIHRTEELIASEGSRWEDTFNRDGKKK